MDKNYLLNSIENNYFYGINFDTCSVDSIKRFDNEKKEMLNVYNVDEKINTFAFIKSLYIEYDILRTNLSKARTDEEISKIYDSFRKGVSKVLALFTDSLMKKIGRSIDVEKASEMFEMFDSVGDALIFIYRFCRSEFVEVSKETNHLDEKMLRKNALDAYLKIIKDNFDCDSEEYKKAIKNYKIMRSLSDDVLIEEFMDIFKRAYYEVSKDIDNNVNMGNVR